VTLSPKEWKHFYRDERARLGHDAMRAMIERAPVVPLNARGALIFPHTRLEITGTQVGAVVKAIVASGAEDVLAIGVLHGDSVADEFSLDAFGAMLALASEMASRTPPRVHEIFPTSPDEDVHDLSGHVHMPIVATADPIHHGIGYGTPAQDALAASSAEAIAFARDSIDVQLRALAAHDFDAFKSECARVRSDFRKSGPVLARFLGRDFSFDVIDLALVDYGDALSAAAPTWVAGALVSIKSQ
jgi:hypothetical protein